jgi:hypothetical protein
VEQAGETPSADMMKDALDTFNTMLDAWSVEEYLVYCRKNELFTATAGKASYTIGPESGDPNTTDWVTELPNRITSAFIRDPANITPVDFFLEVIESKKYNSIYQKAATANYPQFLYYNRTYPVGIIYLWPVPATTLAVGLTSWQRFANLSNHNTEIQLPDGYKAALEYNLAKWIAGEYRPLPAEVELLARSTKENLKPNQVEAIMMKTDVALKARGRFNWRSGGFPA